MAFGCPAHAGRYLTDEGGLKSANFGPNPKVLSLLELHLMDLDFSDVYTEYGA